MTASHPPVLARHDTFLGVCEAIGQDFGFHPDFLRAAFALAIFAAPLAALGCYAGAAVLVGLSRWAFPAPSSVTAVVERKDTGTAAMPIGDNDEAEVVLAKAA